MSALPQANYAGAFGFLVGAIRGVAENTVGPRRHELLTAIEEAEWYAEHGTLDGIPIMRAQEAAKEVCHEGT